MLETLCCRLVGEDLAVSRIDDVFGVHRIRPGQVIEGFAFGMDSSQFTVDVFVGAALPRVIGLGEVNVAGERLGDPGMVGEFATVIERDGLDRILEGTHHRDDGFRDGFLGTSTDGTTDQKTRAAFNQGDDGTLMMGANDGVPFPVAKGLPGVHLRRSLVDIDTFGNELNASLATAWTASAPELAME